MADRADPVDPVDARDELPWPEPPGEWTERARLALAGLGWSPGRALLTAAVLVVLAAGAWLLLRPPPAPPELALPQVSVTTAPAPPSSGPPEPTEVVVHAAGAVARPGLYRLPVDARVADLVAAAGGLTGTADAARLNLAAPVADGQRVYVVALGEPEAPVVSGPDGAPPTGPDGVGGTGGAGEGIEGVVDVNTAGLDELDTLPGVGPATAQAIIDHREEHGPFRSVDQLLDVRGIGDAKLAELRDRVRV